ncbi:MAG: ankyrin repeat domain-containing protein [Bryobacteraceae bacterium]|nr:ankyrin repeat domain-containing protein [Bryobacteraceae bacterium]
MHRVILGLALCLLPLSADINEDLLTAARNGDLEQVRALVEKGANIETKTRHGITPLYFAAKNGHEAVVTYLISKGANADVTDTFYGMSAVSSAMPKGNMNLIRALIAGGAKDPNLLSIAVNKKDAGLLKLILDRGGMPQTQLNAALISAERSQAAELVALLKEKGAVLPSVPPEKLQSYAGKYSMEGTEWVLEFKDGKLMSSKPQAFELTPLDETTFQPGTFAGVTFTFQSEGGKPSGFVFKQGARTMNAKRVE